MITLLVVMTVVVLLGVGFVAGMFFEWKYINKHCVLFGKTKKK